MVANAALQAVVDRDNESLVYRLVPECRAILFMHLDLDKSWWQRGESRDEVRMQRIESFLEQVTGLRRIYRKHHELLCIVEFRLGKKHYNAAATALRLSYRPEPVWEKHFDRLATELVKAKIN